MPDASGATERTITIKGIAFNVSMPYSAGHVLTAEEALTLNQTRCENLRNNFASEVEEIKKAAGERDLSEEEIAGLQEKLAKYDAEYVFRGKSAGRAPVDPVAREARKLARNLLIEALNKKGKKIKDLPEDNVDSLIDQILASREDIMVVAKANVSATKQLTETAIDLPL